MTDDRMAQARAGVQAWWSRSERLLADLAEALGAPVDECRREPSVLLPYLQAYVSRLPLEALDDGLLAQLAAYVARWMIVSFGGDWRVVEVPGTRRELRYVVEVTNPLGERRWVDPFAVAVHELRHPPVEVARMLANAEAVTGMARPAH
jgi:hypothetical protein